MSGDIRLECVVVSNSLSTSKEKGTPSVKLQLSYTDPQTGSQGSIYADLWLSETVIQKTGKSVAENSIETLYSVFGWSGKISDLNEPILEGKPCVAVCAYETYEGRSRLKVKFINRVGKPLEKLDKSAAAALDAKFAAIAANQASKARSEGVTFVPSAQKETASAGAERLDGVPIPTEDDMPY